MRSRARVRVVTSLKNKGYCRGRESIRGGHKMSGMFVWKRGGNLLDFGGMDLEAEYLKDNLKSRKVSFKT